ncbi:Sec-independent protein translocase subunit TatA/TatB [Methanosarcina horonobensis]|uniref:Sec-independent protein translocase subunit TatA/TatB n=1 Tax=Methanosarcina horonobensis TaxID=418008 RepID=UPI00373FD123
MKERGIRNDWNNGINLYLWDSCTLIWSDKLPEFARALGSSVGEFRKAKLEVDKEVKELENKQ